MAYVNPVNEIATSLISRKLARILDDNMLALQKSLFRLTTGLRIVDAGDDPAGAAQVIKLNNQIARANSTQEAIDNATSYVESQSEFLDTVSEKLDRLSELANLSTNASTTAEQRSSYQIEFEEIQEFISDIGRRTFNNVGLFGVQTSSIVDEDGGQFTLQAINYSAAFGSGGLGGVFVSTVNVATTTSAASAIGTVSTAIANLGILQARVDSNSTRLSDSKDLLVSLEENLQAVVDRVQNTNTTSETVEFNRLSLLTQTGQTMLANFETLRLGLLDLLQI
ncbi:MAG: flagellin [Verrucomicrobia bacterium]|nr:flagellin [Verrucomicrobiota bacterium]